MDITSIKAMLKTGKLSLPELVETIYEKAEAHHDHNIWIHLLPKETVLAKARQLLQKDSSQLPLYGLPYAVKDNIDVAGLPTTAACPAFSYVPEASADVVQLLEDAGALLIGKTNLDQFATGLVGTRSPYGSVKNTYNKEYISGGSSSGSAVAVGLGLVSFSLGTDTAGSGRVPAGFNNIVGLKPTKGIISTQGVVPACKSLDCVSIFALNGEDAELVLNIAAGKEEKKLSIHLPKGAFTFAVPAKQHLNFFGNTEYAALYQQAVEKLQSAGGTLKEIDFAPFLETAALLYEGPWVAERLASIKDFFDSNSDDLLKETKAIIEGAKKFSAVDTFLSLYKLDELKILTDSLLQNIDFMLVPTSPTIYKIEEIKNDPIQLNKNLGYYTNFVNLLNLSALAVPNGFQSNGLPMGVTLIGAAYADKQLIQYAKKLKP
ncbi:MAG: allophanate hydrolase [Sphingobacteriaceae bacterium]|nr:allophanate hydrolase [Sphingobacteriaceae bacterium]